jgi:hypothetical protein
VQVAGARSAGGGSGPQGGYKQFFIHLIAVTPNKFRPPSIMSLEVWAAPPSGGPLLPRLLRLLTPHRPLPPLHCSRRIAAPALSDVRTKPRLSRNPHAPNAPHPPPTPPLPQL